MESAGGVGGSNRVGQRLNEAGFVFSSLDGVEGIGRWAVASDADEVVADGGKEFGLLNTECGLGLSSGV